MSRTLLTFVLGILVAAPLCAAPLRIDSQPHAIYLRIDGPAKIAGVTPFDVQEWPRGDYRLTVDWVGFAATRARVRSDGAQGLALRRAAGPMALIAYPGYVQFHGGEADRGVVLFAAGTTGGIGLAYAFGDAGNADDDLTQAQRAYDDAVSIDEVTESRLDLESAAERQDDEQQMLTLWAGYVATVWVGSALEAWLFTPPPRLQTTAGGYVVALPRASASQAAWRSILFPGSGQRYLGRRHMANVFATGFWGFAAGALFSQDWYLEAARQQSDAQRRYDAAETEADVDHWSQALQSAADETARRDAWRWSFAAASGAFYVWNVVDAMLAGSASASHSDLAWSVFPTSHGVQTAFRWRLP